MKKLTLIIGLFVCFAGTLAAQSFDPAQTLITKLENAEVNLDASQVQAVNDLANATLKAEYPQGGTVKTNSSFSAAVSTFKEKVFKDIMTPQQRDKFNESRR